MKRAMTVVAEEVHASEKDVVDDMKIKEEITNVDAHLADGRSHWTVLPVLRKHATAVSRKREKLVTPT